MIPNTISCSRNDYIFLDVIGTGSFATVYRAKHLPTQKMVAVKSFEKAKLKEEGGFGIFTNEIKISSRADHPLIATVFEAFEDIENFFISMELIPNDSLLNFINSNGGLSEGIARKLFCQIVLVVDFLHNHLNVTHRDLKAENILLDRFSNIRLIDFGLSKDYDPNSPLLRTICGSPAYAAPELVRGLPYTKAIDLWSIGIILFAMIAGFLPFDDPNVSEQLRKIINDEPEYPSNISPVLIDLLKKLLCKDPESRLTIERVRDHPWVAPTLANIGASEHFRVVDLKNIDTMVLQQMIELGIHTEQLVPLLLKGELCRETASYKILRKENMLVDINETFARIRSHRLSHAGQIGEILSTSALPSISPLSSRALSQSRGHQNVQSSPGSVPPMPKLPPVPGLPHKPKVSVPDSPLLSSSKVKHRTRALTFMKKEIVSPIVEKNSNTAQRSFL